MQSQRAISAYISSKQLLLVGFVIYQYSTFSECSAIKNSRRGIFAPSRVTEGQKNTKAYCRYGNIREILFFMNFTRNTNSRIQEPRKMYYYNSDTKEKVKIREF